MNTGNGFEFRRAGSADLAHKTLPALLPIMLLLTACLDTPRAYAAETPAGPDSLETRKSPAMEVGFEIGALTLLGTDVRVFFRQADSPWVIGYRLLDIEDDFVNEAAVGLPGDDSDKEYTKRSGLYVTYLFNANGSESYYLSGALYRAETTVVCSLGQGSDSATSPYFGGGYRKKWNANMGYDIGLMLSPGASLSVETPDCSSESGGDFDLNASLMFTF